MKETDENTSIQTEKTEDTALFTRPKFARFQPENLALIQNLVAAGVDVADIGMLMGYEGANWKISASKTLGSDNVKLAIENGLRMAEAQMVADLIKDADGYEYEEVKTTYKYVEKIDPVTATVELKKIPVSETRINKRIPGSARLKELLVCNRLPEIFKKVSEVRRASFKVESKMSDEQIDELIGRLLDKAEAKPVESVIVETEDGNIGTRESEDND